MPSIKTVTVGGVPIGGGHPISVQSMTNTDTCDVVSTLEQVSALVQAGCQIVRVAVPNEQAAEALPKIVENAGVPIVADIHFDYKLALSSIKAGVAKLRINPGNIGSPERVREVVAAAKDSGIPIRIGVNGGSLEKELLRKYGRSTPEAMVESAKGHVGLLENENFEDIIISLKASDVLTTVEAYRLASVAFPYPLHIGITEAGTVLTGAIRSSVGISLMLNEGIGDTVRVSLTGNPVNEVRVAREILASLNLAPPRAKVISCPTCGRCQVDIAQLAEEAEKLLMDVDQPITVAVMGCAVNGPGEAREADLGIAGGKGEGLLFRKGEIVAKVPENKLMDVLRSEISLLRKTSE